jgi:hypothetical protein
VAKFTGEGFGPCRPYFLDDDAGQGDLGSPGSDGASPYRAPVRTEPHPTKRVREEPPSYRGLAMATEIGWRPAPKGEPGMGVRTPLEAIR